MGKPTGFKEFHRETPKKRPVELRILDWDEIYLDFPEDKLKQQGARCMDCGIPFCNNGCPLGNRIPDWNDLIYRGHWKDALDQLLTTNNFPEFTGRICPAPCEEACVLSINDKPVTIKLIEQSIIDKGFKEGWIKARPPERRTGKKVAVVGSGPAGLACAAQLNSAGHSVTVFERHDTPGGLMIYGIPDFKMSKEVVLRRIHLMEEEGIKFQCHANVGVNVGVDDLKREFDAIVLCVGATKARDVDVPGRDLEGVHLAMTYLPQPTKVNLSKATDGKVERIGSRYGGAEVGGVHVGDQIFEQQHIDAKDKHVLIIGGGDTAADCLGTAHRQMAKSVTQFNIYPEPPKERTQDMPWPYWPATYRTSPAHEEGGSREWAVTTKRFEGDDAGHVRKVIAAKVETVKDPVTGRRVTREISGTEFELPCDLCLVAIGFGGPETGGPIEKFGLELDDRGNVKVNPNYATNVPGIFACGDARRGQSLVVWAISEGRCAAHGVDKFLMGKSDLPWLDLL